MTLLANAPVTSSDVITISSGTVTLSSAPLVIVASSSPITQTLTVVNTSSGLVQIAPVALISLGTTAAAPVAVLVTSSAGPAMSAGVNTAAGYGPVTSSAGRLSSLSSGIVTLSSVHTVTATAATNPWSSAPGFNMPVVSVSSGLVQISGTVVAASSGLVQISGTPLVTISSSAAITPATLVATTVSKISAGAGALYSLIAFTTGADGSILRLYNATTANVVMNTAVVAYLLTGNQTSAAIQSGQPILLIGPRPMNFATACSFDVVPTATSTLATAGKTYVTWQFA